MITENLGLSKIGINVDVSRLFNIFSKVYNKGKIEVTFLVGVIIEIMKKNIDRYQKR